MAVAQRGQPQSEPPAAKKKKEKPPELEYEPPDTSKPPKPPPLNAPDVVLVKEVEPGRWVMTLGALFMMVSFGCGAFSAFGVWWKHESQEEGVGYASEVTLWDIKTVITEQQAEVEHFGCQGPCDQTRVINNKKTTREQTWTDSCRNHLHMQETCVKIDIIRLMMGIGVLCAFVYMLPACISFSGSDNRSHVRFNPVVGLVLGSLNVVCLLAALITAAAVDGKVPYAGDEEEDRRQDLDGDGFNSLLASLAFGFIATLVAFASQVVAAIFEKAPFGWDDDDRPTMRRWGGGFAQAPTALPPMLRIDAWEDVSQPSLKQTPFKTGPFSSQQA